MSAQQSDTVNFYLAELTLALQVLPVETRRDIHRGIAEELRGLDEESARARIYEFGDPKYIAAAALDEVGVSRPAEPARHDKTWYTLTTVFALLIGGVIIPLFGWFGGVVLLWSSKTWQLRDKIVGTLVIPFGLATSLFLVSFFGGSITTVTSSDGVVPAASESSFNGNPIHAAIAWAVALLPFYAAVHLLVRARKLKQIS